MRIKLISGAYLLGGLLMGMQNPPRSATPMPPPLSVSAGEPGNVFFADQHVMVKVTAPNGPRSVRTQLTTYDGRTIKTPTQTSVQGVSGAGTRAGGAGTTGTTRALLSAGSGTPALLDLGVLPRGYYELIATDGQRQVRTHITVVPRPRPRRAARAAVDAAHAWLIPPDRYDEGAELLRRAGFTCVRERFSWPEVEQQRGRYTWGRYDAVAEADAKRGIQVCQVFHQVPGWARGDHATNRFPDDLRDVYRFCKAAAEHYRGKVQAWEVWNEADISVFSEDPASDYAAFLKAAYLGFKAGDPKVSITQVSLALASPRYHEALYENGSQNYFDIFNYHIYDRPAVYPERARGHFEIMGRAGVPQVPVWLTEAGIPLKAVNDTLTEQDKRRQAEFIPKSYAMSLASGTDRHFFFVFPHYLENGVEFGTMDANLKPYPGFAALATAVDALGEGRYLGRLQAGSDVDGHVFNNGSGETLVLWSDQPPASLVLDAPARRTQVFDCVGEPIQTRPVDEGRLRLEFGNAPIYVRAPRGTFTNYVDDRVKRQPAAAPPPRFAARDLVLRLRLPDECVDKKIEAYTLAANRPTKLRIEVYNFGPAARRGTVLLAAPAGWKLAPMQFTASFAPGSRGTFEATLTPSPSPASGRGEVSGVIVPSPGERWTGGRPQSAPVVLDVLTRGG